MTVQDSAVLEKFNTFIEQHRFRAEFHPDFDGVDYDLSGDCFAEFDFQIHHEDSTLKIQIARLKGLTAEKTIEHFIMETRDVSIKGASNLRADFGRPFKVELSCEDSSYGPFDPNWFLYLWWKAEWKYAEKSDYQFGNAKYIKQCCKEALERSAPAERFVFQDEDVARWLSVLDHPERFKVERGDGYLGVWLKIQCETKADFNDISLAAEEFPDDEYPLVEAIIINGTGLGTIEVVFDLEVDP